MAIQLVVTAGPHAGRTFRFEEHATFLVGRSPQATFALPEKDPYVSRFHFLVEVNPPLVRLRDMGSRNGTLVNGQRIEQADLREGDAIGIGETQISVRLEGAPLPFDPQTLMLPAAESSSRNPSLPRTLTAPQSGARLEASPVGGGTLTCSVVDGAFPDIPGYRIETELGRGGMGVVYRAQKIATGEVAAIKMILPAAPPSRTGLGKFLREAAIVRELDHPNVVRYLDAGTEGTIWFAMEFVEGQDASRIAQQEKRLPIRRAIDWTLQLLAALSYAHAKGFVHRDVKPSNLLVSRQSGREVVKLADFGLARAYEASSFSGLTLTGAAGGTPQFMPPEQVLDMRSAQPAADQYAAAATLYRLLAGTYPYPKQEKLERMFRQILESDPQPLSVHLPGVPAPLAAAIHRALDRDPKARFPDVTQFAKAIQPFAA